MAEKTAATDQKLETYAFRLFSDRSAARRNAATEQGIIDCFRDAGLFMAIAAKVTNGELSTEKSSDPELADACAPNLRANHPINLVSQRFAEKNGGEAKVLSRINRIAKYLKGNPTLETLPTIEEEVGGEKAIVELAWDKSETNTARAILPAYATN